MTREEMFGLAKGDLVVVKSSGKVYRALHFATTYADGGYLEPEKWRVWFRQQRNGKDYGQLRDLKPENIEKVGLA